MVLFAEVMPSCSEFLIQCWWRGEERKCSDLFEVRKTDEGFCCSLNTLDLADSYVVPEDTDSAASSASSFMGAAGCNYGNYDYDYHHYDSTSTSSRKNFRSF